MALPELLGAQTADTIKFKISRTTYFEKAAILGDKIWISSDGSGVVKLDLNQDSFEYVNSPDWQYLNVTNLIVHKNQIFITHKFHGVLRWQSDENKWVNITPPVERVDSTFFALTEHGNTLATGGGDGRLYLSEDGGNHWKKIQLSLKDYIINDIIFFENNWYIATENSELYQYNPETGKVKERE